jgi:UDP-glucose 4-epimerase
LSTWLVTGGAGYIGAHVVKSLLENDFKVVIVDDLSTGLARKVPQNVIFEKIDNKCVVVDFDDTLVKAHKINMFGHFAPIPQIIDAINYIKKRKL